MSNSVLKEVLNQKVAAQSADAVVSQVHNAVVEKVSTILMPPSLSVVLTFSVPLHEAQPQIERIQSLVASLGLQNGVEYQVRPSLIKPIASIRSIEPVALTTLSGTSVAPKTQTPSNVAQPLAGKACASQAPSASTAPSSPLPMTEKQRTMIISLVSKKKLSAKAVEVILQREFGHTDGAALSKNGASRLIDRLMAV